MRLATTSTGIVLLLTLTFAPVDAGQKAHSGSHGPKATTTHGPSPKVTHAPATTPHGPAAKATSVKPVKGPSAKPVKGPSAKAVTSIRLAKVDAKSAKVNVKSTKVNAKSATTTTASSTSKKTTTSTTTATSGGTTGATTIDFTSGKAGSKLSKNSALRSKIESRLAALGYDGTAYQAAYGFKNLGQFVAATNVSKNLGIPFEQLKIQMTGLSVAPDGTVLQASVGTDGKITMLDPAKVTEPASTKTLGQSIQTVKSNVDAIGEAQTATMQADAEIQRTSTTAVK